MQAFLAELWALVVNFVAYLLALFRRKNSIYFDVTKMSVFVDSGSGSLDDANALGEGAFSTVYRAASRTDPSQLYAVKKMHLQTPDFERALFQEVDSLQRFRHANIIRLIDSQVVSEGAGKVAYLLFPLMKRGTLRDELNRTILAPTAASPLGSRSPHRHARALQQVLSDFLGIVSALHVLHSHSPAYVHQDVKPENVLIADDGTPLLTDFGSVRLAEIAITNRAQSLAVADEAASFCTVSYRAPELFDPPKGSRLDTRTDVWAAGCLLFAWWHGFSPFECDFTESGQARVTPCSHLRVLSQIPRVPAAKATSQDVVIQALVEWILERDFAVRVFAADVVTRVRDALLEGEERV